MRERARECDAQALRGRCSEDLPFPYRPFVEALEEPLEDVLGAEAGALAHLLQRGSIDQLGDRDRRTGSGAEQLGLFRATSRGCLSLAQLRPTMLLLEDLHWADGSSLDLLEHVVFAVSETAVRAPVRLLILCTYRGGEIGARLARTLARLRREDIAVAVELPGLDEGEIQLLIRALGLGEPTHQLVTSISATTRGNPLLLQELLHDLAKRGALRRRGGYLAAVGDLATARLPAELMAVIAARMQPLGERCRDVLRHASLLGLRFSLRTLAAASATSEETLLTVLEEAIQQRLLVSDGPIFEFAHPLVRHVLAGEHSGVRAQRMHRRIAEALQRLHSPGTRRRCARDHASPDRGGSGRRSPHRPEVRAARGPSRKRDVGMGRGGTVLRGGPGRRRRGRGLLGSRSRHAAPSRGVRILARPGCRSVSRAIRARNRRIS